MREKYKPHYYRKADRTEAMQKPTGTDVREQALAMNGLRKPWNDSCVREDSIKDNSPCYTQYKFNVDSPLDLSQILLAYQGTLHDSLFVDCCVSMPLGASKSEELQRWVSPVL